MSERNGVNWRPLDSRSLPRAKRRGSLALTMLALACVGAWQEPGDIRKQVRALAETGKLDEAESAARGAGAAAASVLGEVLVVRGKLAAADSAFRVAITSDPRGRRTAEVSLAELAYARGARDDGLRLANALTTAYENSSARWSSDDLTAVGRAYVLLGTRAAAPVRAALAVFDKAVAADASNIEARLRTGDLFLDKYNAPEAKSSYDDVLKVAPGNARALLGLARVAEFEGKRDAMAMAQKSMEANPSLTGANILLARFHLEAEAYDSAAIYARRALAVDSSSIAAWSLIGATAFLTGKTAEYDRAKATALRLNSKPSEFFAEAADAAIRQRRYADGMRFAREAVDIDSTSVRALGILGTNQMRAGNIEAARATLERAFAIDPFNLWHKNTLDLIDNLKKFRTIDRGRFRIVAPEKEAEMLALYLVPLLEQAYDSLAKRYAYKPTPPIRLEIYDRHADFSVRTVGLTGLGALGVSFGPVLAIDAPSARARGEFNWGSTSWHELAHTFTLGLSENRAPRWLSEGLSVLEERRARPEWGAQISVEFLAAYTGGRLRPVSTLNDGFVRPRFEQETIFSYYEASLVCEMIEQMRGSGAIVDILKAYRDGADTPGVFAKVLGMKPDSLDKQFDTWLRAKFATPILSIAPNDGKKPMSGAFVETVRAAVALVEADKPDSARAMLLKAQAMFPEYAGAGNPAWVLAHIARDKGDHKEALAQVVRMTTHNENTWDANLFEADTRLKLGDATGSLVPLQRLTWISPYDIDVHKRIAETAALLGDHATALRERRAILLLDPPDLVDAHYQLALALSNTGDVVAAKRELLTALEQAPAFEKAQTLLLELSKRTVPAKP
ncbi:MAG: hypothetical protein V4550_06860 [Gemmatimonadota bacterium]